jgi:hypothetical protein
MTGEALLPKPGPRGLGSVAAIGVTLSFLLVGIVLFDRAMAQPFSHDEHQFIAAGWWLAKGGLLPYRDFPYHHMPYQIPLNALAVDLSPYVLLSGRLVSWAAAWMASGVLMSSVWSEFRMRSKALAVSAAGLAVLVFVSQPIVAYTTGQAWNHDWANLLALGAVLLQVKIVGSRPRPGLEFAVGLLAGLATGVRLSYAVLCPLLLVSAAVVPATPRGRWTNTAALMAGIAVAGIPATILLAIDPKAFGYGNVLYPTLNSVYRQVLSHWSGEELLTKFSFFGETVLLEPGNTVLLVGTLALGTVGLTARLRDRTSHHALLLVFSATLLLFMTGFAPTPAWYQYFFACVPFAILTCAMVAARVSQAGWNRAAMIGAAVVGCLCVACGTWDTHMVRRLQSPTTWVPIEVHQFGRQLAEEVREGPVLTLGPVLAMEAGLRTYEAFATGPFTWRVAHIIPEANRRLVGWIGRDDLDTYLAASPPTAVLTGLETENEGFEPGQRGNLEEPLEAYAVRMGFHRIPFQVPFITTELSLWTSPSLPSENAP